uniref:Uncharacterized protein n=1 Tax=Lactuca sativa TaxID=4236 RepID=A0A9R1WBA6_LACSA|nr:hypothetical protein LSAT_V11C200068860 [Lactuca sativa]
MILLAVYMDYVTIVENKIPERTPVDVIGHVVLYFMMDTFMSKHGEETHRHNLQIQNFFRGKTVSFTLWVEYSNGYQIMCHIIRTKGLL